MSNDDFLFQSVNTRMGIIDAAQQRLLADIAEHKQYGNTVEAGEAIQQLANLDAEKRNLQQTRSQYIQANQPPRQPHPDSWRTKRLEEMNYDDALQLHNSNPTLVAKYGKLTHADCQQGYAEVVARRQNNVNQS